MSFPVTSRVAAALAAALSPARMGPRAPRALLAFLTVVTFLEPVGGPAHAADPGFESYYLYLGNQDTIEVPIVNGRMALNNYRPNSFAPTLSFVGTFDSGSTASGTIEIGDEYPNSACTARWNVTKQ